VNNLFNNILVSVYTSKAWKSFLNYISFYFPDSFYYILSVIDTSKFVGRGSKLYEAYLSDLIENSIGELSEFLKEKNLKFKVIIEKGRVKDRVFEVSESKNVDLIVIGNHSAAGIKRLKLGSIAKDIIINSHKPVLIMNTLNEPSKNPKILNPTTGSSYSFDASITSLKLAKQIGGSVTTLFLTKDKKLIDDYFKKLENLAKDLNIKIDLKIMENEPLTSILNELKSHDFTVGSRGYKGFKYKLRFLFKEFSLDYVVRSTITISDKPVLLICD